MEEPGRGNQKRVEPASPTAGCVGGLFAIGILFLFLRRIDMTLVVSMAIPISILCGSAFLYYLGYTFNVMSMMGLMLSVGMLVDERNRGAGIHLQEPAGRAQQTGIR